MSDIDPIETGPTGSVWCNDCQNWDFAFDDGYLYQCHETIYDTSSDQIKTYRKNILPVDFLKRNSLGRHSYEEREKD